MSTTYTITNGDYDGRYTISTGALTPAATEVSSTVWAILHFAIGTWDHTLLTAASFAFLPTLFTAGSYAVDVIIAKDGVPTGALITAARRVQVGTLVVVGAGAGAARVTFDFKVASVATEAGGTFTWTPTDAFATQGTANSAAFGTVNAAWTKHERNPADNTLFLGRSLTLVFRQTAGGDIIMGDVETTLPPQLIVTTAPSNTGLVGTQYIRDLERGRASGVIECPKTGHDFPADEAMRDGYTGLMVSPEGYDPPEPRRRTNRPLSLNPRRVR